MGGSAKKIVAVAAAVAIPFVAPVIATSIGLSAAIGATAASAATGAVLGGVTAAATGGDVGRGALMGGISGGIAGYNYVQPGATAAPISQATGVPAAEAAAGTTLPAAPAVATGYGMSVAPNSLQAALPELTGTGLSTPVPGAEPSAFRAALPDFGVTLSTPTAAAPAGLNVATAPTAAPTAAPTPTAAPGTQVFDDGSTLTTAAGGQVSSTQTPYPTPTVSTGQPTTFTQAIQQVPGAIAEKFKDPKALADLTLRAAGQLAGSLIAGDGMSPEERQLLEAERADLERLRGENEALFRERLDAARNLMGESKYFDPEYFGLQSARRAQLAGARSRQAGLRGLRGRQRDVAARQYDLATSRTAGTAFDVGSQTGLTGRLQTQQAGLAMMPSGFPSVNYSGIREAYDSAAQRRAREVGGVQRLFGSITGIA